MSLRTLHLLFILVAIVGADLFGAWAVWTWSRGGPPSMLALGIVSAAGGIGLIVYAWRFVRQLDRAQIR